MYSERLVQWLMMHPQVAAIGIGGSQASGMASDGSDVDVYVFTTDRIPPAERRAIARELADDQDVVEIANPYWGDEDGYAIGGVWHDVVYFELAWFLSEIERATVLHQPREGYSTSFVFTLQNLRVLHDPHGTIATTKAAIPEYPDELARAIIDFNLAVAGDIHASYANQVARAVVLSDPVAANHRVAALLACVSDIAFAHLRMWHPGEKRQLQYLRANAGDLPAGLVERIEQVLLVTAPDRMNGLPAAVADLMACVNEMRTSE